MTPAKRPRTAAPAAPEPPAVVSIRGMTVDDIASVDRAVARRLRTAPPGAQLSRNAVMLAVLRDALAREDSADAAAPVEAKP